MFSFNWLIPYFQILSISRFRICDQRDQRHKSRTTDTENCVICSCYRYFSHDEVFTSTVYTVYTHQLFFFNLHLFTLIINIIEMAQSFLNPDVLIQISFFYGDTGKFIILVVYNKVYLSGVVLLKNDICRKGNVNFNKTKL